MTTKELQQEIISNMGRWQKVENAAVASTAQIMERTENPFLRIVMEIILRDSQMHQRIQEWVAESLQYRTVTLTPDELKQIWGMIEQHVEIEKRTLELAKQSLASIRDKKMVMQEYLLQYLAEDERKHNQLLKQLETIKKGVIP
jgi:hypothetical protein